MRAGRVPARQQRLRPGQLLGRFSWEKRSNATHQSTRDPEARLFRKGKCKEAKLEFLAHALMENRNGMLTDFQVTGAKGTPQRDASSPLLAQHGILVRRLISNGPIRYFRAKTLSKRPRGKTTPRDIQVEMDMAGYSPSPRLFSALFLTSGTVFYADKRCLGPTRSWIPISESASEAGHPFQKWA